MSLYDYLKIEISINDFKTSLTINPVGKFNPGGCLAYISSNKDAFLEVKTNEELFELLTNKIYFENLEVAFDLDNYSLKNVLDYTNKLEVNDDNSWYLNYFKDLIDKVRQFKNELLNKPLVNEIIIKEYHASSEELCDFVDYLCVPEGEDNDTLQEFFENTLSKESEIETIMDHFEEGYCYINGYNSELKTIINLQNKSINKSLTVDNIQ